MTEVVTPHLLQHQPHLKTAAANTHITVSPLQSKNHELPNKEVLIKNYDHGCNKNKIQRTRVSLENNMQLRLKILHNQLNAVVKSFVYG